MPLRVQCADRWPTTLDPQHACLSAAPSGGPQHVGAAQVAPDATPSGWAGGETPAPGATPTPKKGRSRWDETPMGVAATPGPGATPAMGGMPAMTPGATPMGGLDMMTPSPSNLAPMGTPSAEQYQVSRPPCLPVPVGCEPQAGQLQSGCGQQLLKVCSGTQPIRPACRKAWTKTAAMDPLQPVQLPQQALAGSDPWLLQAMRWEREVQERNRPLSDEELDSMLPSEGYKVLDPPPGYQPVRTPARKLQATPTPYGATPLYQIPEEDRGQKFDVPQEIEGLPELKPEDHQYFGKLLKEVGAALCVRAATVVHRAVWYSCLLGGGDCCSNFATAPWEAGMLTHWLAYGGHCMLVWASSATVCRSRMRS